MTDVGNLVVKVAMDNSNFQQGVQNLNRSMRKVQSEFKNATAGLKDHGEGLDFLKAQQEKLSKTIELQSQKVDMHKKKFEESKKTLDDNVKAQTELKEKVDNAKKAYEESKATLGENAEETKKLKTEYEELSAEYDSNNEKIQNNVRTMENWETKANNAEAQLKNLQSELDATNKEIEKQSSGWYKLSEKLKPIGKKMQSIGNAMADIGKGLTTKLTLPIVGIGTAASKIGLEFEASMSNVKALSGATGEELKSLEVKAREMGASTSKSAKDAADGMGFLALAGWDTQQIIGGIEPVLRLAEAGNMDLAQSADLTANSMSAMGLSVEELPHYLDLVAQAARNSNTDIDEMMQAYIAVGGTLRGLNVPMEESAVILGLLANKGIKGAEAGTALNAVMMNLTAPTGRAAKALDKLNLSAFNGNGEFKGLTNVLMEVKEKTKDMTEEQKNQILAMIGGKEHVKDLNALLNGLEEDYGTLSTAIDGADGALMDMSKTMQDNNKGSLTELKSAIEELALKIYDVLRPKIASIIETLQKWTDKLNSLTPAQQETIIKIAEMLAVIGPLLFAGGKLIGGIGTMLVKFSILSESIAKIGGATKLLGVALKGLPILALIAAVTAGTILIAKNWDTIKEKTIELKETVTEKWEELKESTIETWNNIKESTIEVWNNIKESTTELISSMIEGISEKWTNLKEGTVEMFTSIGESISETWNNIKEKLIEIVTDIVQGINEKFQDQIELISDVMSRTKDVIVSIWEVIKTVLLGIVLVILDIVTLNFEQLGVDVSNINEKLKNMLKEIWHNIKMIITNLVIALSQTLDQIWTGIKNTVINLSRAIWNGVKSIWNGIKQSIINLAKGAWQGVKNAFNNMKQSAINITRNIKTSIVSIWNGILSWFRTLPSKLKTIAVNMFNAMKDGIVNTMNNVTTAAKDVGTGIKDAFKELPGKLLEIGKNLMTSLAKGIRDKILAPVEAAKEAAEKTAEKFREKLGIASPSKVFRGFGHNIDEGLALGIQDKAILVEKAAKDLANKTIKSIDVNLDIKSKSNINTDVVKKKAAEIVKIGEDAEFKFKKTIQNMNADDLEETKWWLDNEYRYQEKIVNRKLELLLKANRAEDKEQIENLRKRRDNLKSNFDYAMKIVDEHNKKMNESAEKNSTKFNETMYKIDESIKILSDDTDDLTQNLTNQKAIIILQERKVAELEKQYNKLCSTLGTSADITKKTKEELEKSREELEKYGNTVVETEKKIKQSQIDSINDLTSRLKKALKERYDEELKTQEKAIKDEIDNLDTWKKESIERIDNVYDLKVRRIEEAAEVQIKALQNEIDALDEAEKKKTREEEDAERVRKIQRLKEALKYEHDEFNKVEIQKELNKEITDREEQLRKWQVEDRKESLNNQIKDVKDNADKQKDALKQQQEFEKDRINYIYEYEKTVLENRLEKVKEFYDEKTRDAALQAEAEKMIFDNQQEEIIKLLHSYEEDYKQAGQSLGEKLVEGFEPKIQEIMNMIDSIQTSFESARNNAIQGMSKMSAMREAGNTSISNKTVNNSNSKIVNNNVNINSPKALNHREVNRQTENTLRRLALT